MKEYTTENIRNVAFLGHSGSGKSTLSEALLFGHKQIDRMGKTEDGTLTSDGDPEEIKRHMSINASILPIETKAGVKINIIDCPGNRDFIGEIKSSLRMAEGCIIFVDASSGVQVGMQLALEYAEEADIPIAFFINKLDKENTDFAKTCEEISQAIGKKIVPFSLPIGTDGALKGIVDIMHQRAFEEAEGKVKPTEIPADLLDEVKAMKEQLVEAAAEGEDELMEKFFDEGELTDEEVNRGMEKAFESGLLIPVFCGCATTGLGLTPFLDFLVNSFPTPADGKGVLLAGEDAKYQAIDPSAEFSAFVFKSVTDDFAGRLNYFKVVCGKMSPASPLYNNTQDRGEKAAHIMVPYGKKQEEVAHIHAGDIGVVAKLSSTHTNDTLAEPKHPIQYAATTYPQYSTVVAIQAKFSKDEDKVGMGLNVLREQDPTLQVAWDPEVLQTQVFGMGDQHLDIAIERLKAKTKVEVELSPTKIRYRETITKKAEGTYRHKKQSGGRGQFAEVSIRLSPNAEEDYSFTWSVFGGAIPTNFQSAVDKGAQMAMEKGILAGYRVVGINVDCYDGKHHPVDSSDMAFQIAAIQAVKQIALQAGAIILEPILDVTTIVPDQFMGDVMGDISQRRGRIQGTENSGNKVIVKAQVPEGEMQTYSQNLRSFTGGRGTFERAFARYEPVPREIQDKIVEEAQKEAEEEA